MVRRLPITTTVNEFLDALPPKLVCGAAPGPARLHRRGRARRRRRAAEKAKGCGDMPIWMTEAGAGAPHTATRAPAGARPSSGAAAAVPGS